MILHSWDSSQNRTVNDPIPDLQSQFSNPGDILSLLLLIGGDTVQQALAQFAGVRVRPFRCTPPIGLTPVAFSFGWVAYAFTALISAVGDNQLMPDKPDYPAIVLNTSNGFMRENKSWVLGRMLRDHISSHEIDETVSLRIDIFTAVEGGGHPDIDNKWVFGWAVILMQLGISAVPWLKNGDWAIFLVTLCGTMGALIAGALPQWIDEKWAGRRLTTKKKTMCLTRGNGHRHVMVFISDRCGWDIEALASASSASRPETRWMLLLLAAWWTLLLITASGLQQHTWFLVGIGGLGMLQNVYAAGAVRKMGASDIHVVPYAPCPSIIGYRDKFVEKDRGAADSEEELQLALQIPTFNGRIQGVMGALMALERVVPKAGATLLTVFFPGGLKYEPERLKFNHEKKFWKGAFRHIGKPVARMPKKSQEIVLEPHHLSSQPSGIPETVSHRSILCYRSPFP